MPRYVLLFHECPPNYERTSHWDFMLEDGGALCTWALPHLPRDWSAAQTRTRAIRPDCPQIHQSNEVAAERLGDHRIEYLDLEGPLSGDRGKVSRVAAGNYSQLRTTTEYWIAELAGDLAGMVKLQQLTVVSAWRLAFTPTD